ncbi:MAG: serine/threonine-protein kinase [Oscillatoria sp. PMC 1051.18]|nr:serine/threonine-protein kinase [Oscillatoria sp. PMC 1050.18]MEC5031046.1 serine/threonine-protein kinase [Oscillatoria sp. PMC 1051.18]
MAYDPNYGRLLANRYQLIELVGKGAMGRVYRAEDTLLGGVTVAVKFLSGALLNKKMRERFEREATICALLGEKSIHVVRVRDYGVDEDDIPFYVMEFLEGESLSDLLRKQSLPLPRFVNMVRQISLGLQAAHKGIKFQNEICPIIHRDIKPSNILVLQDPSLGELVKILDFGIAKLIQSSSNQTHSFMGTLAYCSPEQMEGKELDSRSDIYSLGVVMYEMLTNEMPIVPETHSFGGWYQAHHHVEPSPFDPSLKIPSSLSALIVKCLAKAPSDRPQSAAEILDILEPLEKSFSKNRSRRWDSGKDDRTFVDAGPTIDDLCGKTKWPSDKPRQKIVFPRLIRTKEAVFATLWTMLGKQDIENRLISTRYNQFLFLTSPHPMVLWITVLHNQEYGPRWLPCYLDLKTSAGQRMARILGESGSYRILFFALEDPKRCQNVLKSTIDPTQCKMLIKWADDSQGMRVTASPQISKNVLKKEFERLKPKILMRLEAVYTTGSATDLSGG